jgi:hypothetical protein
MVVEKQEQQGSGASGELTFAQESGSPVRLYWAEVAEGLLQSSSDVRG